MDRQPNIVFMFSDQQRWDTLGCYGQPLDVTPNLDQMAAQGVRFEHAFTCQPVCGPARASIQTGKFASESGCYRNNIALPLHARTIAHYLNAVGYRTAYIGKWHLASDDVHDYTTKPIPPERRGGYKDFWLASDVLEFTSNGYGGFMYNGDMEKVEFNGYRADCMTDFAIDYLRNQDGQKPFFLFLSYLEPHHQNDRNRYEGPEGSKEKFKDFVVPGDLVGTEGDWKTQYPDYLGCCHSLDYSVGRIRAELDNLGLSENTVLVYTSDHGNHFMTRNNEYKRSCHESSIRIPLIIYGPSFPRGKVINELVSLIDIAPTILECAGIPTPDNMQGRPLQELVEGRGHDWPNEVFIQISESHVGRAIRTDRWKYSVRAPHKDGWADSSSDVYVEDCLYDLQKDPYEKENLAVDPAYDWIRMDLRERLLKRMAAAREAVPVILPAGTKVER